MENLVFAAAVAVNVGLVVLVFAVRASLKRTQFDADVVASNNRRWVKEEIQRLESRLRNLEPPGFERPRRELAAVPAAQKLGPLRDSGQVNGHGAWETRQEAPRDAQRPHGIQAPGGEPIDAHLELEKFYEAAAAALQSAAAFNALAERCPGKGYRIEASGPPPVPEAGPPDKADIYVIDRDNERLVLPGFGLRRVQGLLTSDGGRAAQERLGWLFDIVRGTELKAQSGALVELGNWQVRRKGRLSLPLL